MCIRDSYGGEAKNLLRDLQSRNERMFLLTLLVLNLADTKQKLDNEVFGAAAIAQKYNCILTRLDYRQEQGLMSSIPLGENLIHIDVYKRQPYITLEKAQEIALTQANVNAANAVFDDREFDHDDGTPIFELEFTANGNEYEYDIHAVTGKVVRAEHKTIGTQSGNQNTSSGSGNYDDTDYGPNNDGVTDYNDTDYGPNNDGVTDYNDTDYGPNNDGVTDYNDTDYGPNNDGVTDYNDTDYGPNNDGVTDYNDTDYGPNNDGVTDYNDTDYGPNNDGVTDYNDTDYGPNSDGVTDYNDTNYGDTNYDDGGSDYSDSDDDGDSGYDD